MEKRNGEENFLPSIAERTISNLFISNFREFTLHPYIYIYISRAKGWKI